MKVKIVAAVVIFFAMGTVLQPMEVTPLDSVQQSINMLSLDLRMLAKKIEVYSVDKPSMQPPATQPPATELPTSTVGTESEWKLPLKKGQWSESIPIYLSKSDSKYDFISSEVFKLLKRTGLTFQVPAMATLISWWLKQERFDFGLVVIPEYLGTNNPLDFIIKNIDDGFTYLTQNNSIIILVSYLPTLVTSIRPLGFALNEPLRKSNLQTINDKLKKNRTNILDVFVVNLAPGKEPEQKEFLETIKKEVFGMPSSMEDLD